MPENLYFRQPTTQTMLLDILFIWSRLNSDVGYRQGMHEVLAPVVWAVERDAVDPLSISRSNLSEDEKVMLNVFSADDIEHDSFTIFASIMKQLKSAFAATSSKGEGKGHKYSTSMSSEPEIVARSRDIIHKQLAAVDPQLAAHLTELDIAPQIFLMRWIRLLFGREFPFDQCMELWDTLVSEEMSQDCIDLTCVSMLLRIRWQLVKTDYNNALSVLLHYPSLPTGQYPVSLAEDALKLRNSLDEDSGRAIIFKRTGRAPKIDKRPSPLTPGSSWSSTKNRILPDPRSPHLLPPPRPNHQHSNSFEAVLQNAARSVYSSGERLGVNKAVKDAVGDVRRNVQSIGTDIRNRSHSGAASLASITEPEAKSLQQRLDDLQLRNKSLAKMLEGAVGELWKQQKEVVMSGGKEESEQNEQVKSFTMAIARVQLAQVYLDDPDLPLPEDELVSTANNQATEDRDVNEVLFSVNDYPPDVRVEEPPDNLAQSPPQASPGLEENLYQSSFAPLNASKAPQSTKAGTESTVTRSTLPKTQNSPDNGQSKDSVHSGLREEVKKENNPTAIRPSLQESHFSWMLGQEQESTQRPKSASGPFQSSTNRPSSFRKGREHEANSFLFGDSAENGSSSSKEKGARTDKNDLFRT